MNLQSMLAARIAADKPVRVGLIGAGKFGSMFLAQVPSIAGLDMAAISDLDPERARAACRNVGWDAARIARTRFSEHGRDVCIDERVEVVVEATGDAPAGIAHAIQAIEAGKQIFGALTRYHAVTPDGVWEHYGLTPAGAKHAGMNSQMFNSFLDGTKSAIEMAAVANACSLDVPHDGLGFSCHAAPTILLASCARGISGAR